MPVWRLVSIGVLLRLAMGAMVWAGRRRGIESRAWGGRGESCGRLSSKLRGSDLVDHSVMRGHVRGCCQSIVARLLVPIPVQMTRPITRGARENIFVFAVVGCYLRFSPFPLSMLLALPSTFFSPRYLRCIVILPGVHLQTMARSSSDLYHLNASCAIILM